MLRVIITAAMLTVPLGLAAPAHADCVRYPNGVCVYPPGGDMDFAWLLNTDDTAPMVITDPVDAKNTAMTACAMLSRGVDRNRVVNNLAAADGLTWDQANNFVASAQVAYCPWTLHA
jgi:hypothetical protein